MEDQITPQIDEETRQRVGQVLSCIPHGLYLMTAAFEHRCAAVTIGWVQQVSADPPMVLAALDKGRHLVPVIHESHAFALNQICEGDRLLERKFARDTNDQDDPLVSLHTRRAVTGSPILERALAYMDCQLTRHFDAGGDHDLYVGLVLDADVLHEDEVPVHFTEHPTDPPSGL